MNIPADFKYSKEHEWIKGSVEKDATVTIGITDYAQSSLGDIVYVQLPKVGEKVSEGKVCGEVESTKSVSEIYSPVSGTVTEINSELEKKPEALNQDPYGSGWIAKIKLESTPNSLLDANGYQGLIA
ncbi:MAG: glycine cleavage system protein GcvH [Actinobacteria bacterium]|nr:glycine cleavage system protein GcvH [Actinomycetota bacterium]